MSNLLSIAICIFAPILLLFFIQQNKREHLLVLFLILGISVGVVAGYCNTQIMQIAGLSIMETTIYISPVVEEVLKALPILIFCFFVKSNFKQLIGIAVAVGVGFATIENIIYLLSSYMQTGEIDFVFACLRGFSTGIMHAMTVALLAAALAFVSHSKISFSLAAIGSLSISVTLHGIFNLMINGEYVYLPAETIYVGYCLPILLALIFMVFMLVVRRKQRKNKTAIENKH